MLAGSMDPFFIHSATSLLFSIRLYTMVFILIPLSIGRGICKKL